MRVSISPSGSWSAMVPSSLPARLDETRNQTLGPELAQRKPAHLELAVIGARTAGDLAAVADAARRGVARQLSKLERGGETLLHRPRLVLRDRLEARAPGGKFPRHPAPAVVFLDRTLLRHSRLLSLRV